MDKVIEVFQSFDEGDEADLAYYAGLTPRARVDILLDIVSAHRESLGEAGERFERVCRVVELERS